MMIFDRTPTYSLYMYIYKYIHSIYFRMVVTLGVLIAFTILGFEFNFWEGLLCQSRAQACSSCPCVAFVESPLTRGPKDAKS